MRHRKNKIKLNRTTAHRKALLRNLVKNLFTYESIKTTLTKAKAARSLAEKIITLSKEDNLKNKRTVYSILGEHKLTSRIFREIGPRFKQRSGGYTRIIILRNRKGDGAQMALLSLVELRAKTQTKMKTKKEIGKGEVKQPKNKEVQEQKQTTRKKQKKKGFLGNLRKYLGKDRDSE